MRKKVFEGINLGGIELINRTVRSATVASFATEDGYVTDELINVYKELAEGMVGLIITGTIGVMSDDVFDLKNLRVHDDSYIDGLKTLVSEVHKGKSKIMAQLGHSSNLVYCNPNVPPLAPSAIRDFSSELQATEMTKKDIERFKTDFIAAAKRCQEAGFDGVQVHAAHGYMLSKFLTPYYNQRTDEYGGSLENRLRIIIELLDEIKKACGKDYPVFLKINSSDFIEEKGFTFEECKVAAKVLSNAGYDAIEISGGLAGTDIGPARMRVLSKDKEAYHRTFAEEIAKEIAVPVILVGGIRSIEVAEEVILDTEIEAVALSRALIREPKLIANWFNGNREKAKCISCNKCFNPNGSVCIFNKKILAKEDGKKI